MKALLAIALGAAAVYLALKANDRRARVIPTLQPMRDAPSQRPEPLRDRDLGVLQGAPF